MNASALRLSFWGLLVKAGHRFTFWAEDHRAAAWRDFARAWCNPCRLDSAVDRWAEAAHKRARS